MTARLTGADVATFAACLAVMGVCIAGDAAVRVVRRVRRKIGGGT